MLYGALAAAGVAVIVAGIALYFALRALKAIDPTRMDSLTELITRQAPATRLAQAETNIKELEKDLETLDGFARDTNTRLDGAIQRIGLARFDSTSDIGGELSFALTLLDARKHGMMLTSLTDHRGTRLFIRGIVAGTSRHPLLPNEEISLQQALEEPHHN